MGLKTGPDARPAGAEDRAARPMEDRLATLGVIGLGVAHELSSPLTTSALSLELLLERLQGDAPPSPRELIESLGRTLAGLQRMGHLVHRLRSLAAGGAPARGEVDLAAAARTALALAELTGARAEVTLRLDSTVTVPADPLLLEQALLCLILNAAEAGQRVTVRTAPGRVIVEDDGVGFREPAAAPQAGWSEKSLSARSGMGVGLSLVELIAGQIGAQLRLANRPEGGAEASLVWPRGGSEG